MTERFIKFIPSEKASWLRKNHPFAFLLLNLVAERACRTSNNPDGLTLNECFIGDHFSIGATRQQYRTALGVLVRNNYLTICETCRTRKKSTTGSTTVGTKVKLLNSYIWDLNNNEANHRINHRPTTGQPPANHEQEYNIHESSNNESIDNESKIIALSDGAHPASPIRSKDALFFNFEKWEFEGVTEKDKSEWKIMYPHIDLATETLKAAQWLKNNPSKSNKKQWRKYLTGWYGRSNEATENKKAFRAAAGGATQDRRTKNLDGTPIKTRAEDLF